MSKTEETSLLERIHGNDPTSVPPSSLQGGQHTGMVGAGVLAKDKNRLGLFEIIQRHRTLPYTNSWLKGGPAGLVAHVRTIRQIVRSKETDKQLIQESRFVYRSSRSVKNGFVRRIESIQLIGD
jgi:hypothetical protein